MYENDNEMFVFTITVCCYHPPKSDDSTFYTRIIILISSVNGYNGTTLYQDDEAA